MADSHALQEAVRERLQLTLELDPRYKVITYAAAYEANTRGPDVALSSSELRGASERWWTAGFASVDASEFRSLLEELVGQGVLSPEPTARGWRLRSANVLRLLGTPLQVEDALLEEEEREPAALESSKIREHLAGSARSPITRAQLADLIGFGSNQVRLVVGSEAMGAAYLGDALEQAAAAPSARFTLTRPKNRAQFKRALEVGGAERQGMVFSDLRNVNNQASCEESLADALSVIPWTGPARWSSSSMRGPWRGGCPMWPPARRLRASKSCLCAGWIVGASGPGRPAMSRRSKTRSHVSASRS